MITLDYILAKRGQRTCGLDNEWIDGYLILNYSSRSLVSPGVVGGVEPLWVLY